MQMGLGTKGDSLNGVRISRRRRSRGRVGCARRPRVRSRVACTLMSEQNPNAE
jgi:hypothetical protein